MTGNLKVSYAQNWPAYNAAQSREQEMLMHLLAELCRGIEQPAYTFGRPSLPLADMVYSSTLKVYSTFSLRRFMSLMKIALEKEHLTKACSYVSVSNYMNKGEMTDILLEMIERSSLPLKSVETEFAADSSGFSISRFGRWYDFRHGKERKYRKWLKAHVMCGVKTNIITSVIITDGDAGDSPMFKYLVRDTAQNFRMKEILADKAYSSRENMEIARKRRAKPFIPFKSNAIGNA